MMRKLWLAAFAVLLMMAMFGGCQLAVENDAATAGNDTLCGVFVTLKPLDFGSNNDEINATLNNLNDVIYEATHERIDAVRHENEDGSVDYTFDGVEGYRFFSTKEMPNGEETDNLIHDDQVQDVGVEVSVTDEGTAINLTGTLYFDVHSPCLIYNNPVYQTADGQVYVAQGNCFSYESIQTTGNCGSTNISATTTETIDGKTTSHSLEAVINLAGVNTNKNVVIKQMNSSDAIIAQTDITQNNIPDAIQVEKDTAYMLMEEHAIDYEGKIVVKRTLLNTDEAFINVLFTGNNGIALGYPVALAHGSGQLEL